MSYIVTTITKHSDYSTINGPEIGISFKGQAYVSKVPGKDHIQITTIQGINLVFAASRIVSVDGAAPAPNIDDLVEQIILAMPDSGGSTDLTDIEQRLDDVEQRLDDIDDALPLKADLVTGKVPLSQLPVQALTTYVNTYADLPAANTVTGQKYGVINSQGTKWLPGSLGGTYYAKGYYYSDGLLWIYMGEFPYQASQSDVNAGIITDQFVSPATLNGSSKWDTKRSFTQTTNGDSNYTIPDSTRVAATSAAFTAARTWTLPLAANVPAGEIIEVSDAFGGVTSTNTLIIQRAGSDTLNGATTETIGSAYGARRFISNGSNAWAFDKGILRASNNLSDLASSATSRTNLGVSPIPVDTETILASPVTITTQSTYYTVFSVSLSPGTYDIFAQLQCRRPAANGTPSFNMRMSIAGTTVVSTSVNVAGVLLRHAAPFLQKKGVVIASTSTLLIEVTDTQNAGSVVDTVNQNGDINATVLHVRKIA